jgi:hypothetical protein
MAPESCSPASIRVAPAVSSRGEVRWRDGEGSAFPPIARLGGRRQRAAIEALQRIEEETAGQVTWASAH